MVQIEILAAPKRIVLQKDEVPVRDLKGGPSEGLLVPSVLYLSLNALFEHCTLESKESQPLPHLDPFHGFVLVVMMDGPNEQPSVSAFPVKLNSGDDWILAG